MSDDSLNLLQGTLDVLVLKALIRGPQHGYAVARWIRETTDGTLEVEEGALYTALHRLEKRKWLRAEWGEADSGRQAKFYALTAAGRKQLAEEESDWERLSTAIALIMRTTEKAD